MIQRRGTGRTTARVLQAIADALLQLGVWVCAVDHAPSLRDSRTPHLTAALTVDPTAPVRASPGKWERCISSSRIDSLPVARRVADLPAQPPAHGHNHDSARDVHQADRRRWLPDAGAVRC